MRTVTLYFTKPRKWKLFSALISWRLGTVYSHVMGTVEEPEFNFSRVYQASRGDINTIKFSNLSLIHI